MILFSTIIKYINSKSSNCQKYSLHTKHFSLARFEDEDVPIKNDSEIESNCATNTSFISLINLTIIYHTMPVDLCKCHHIIILFEDLAGRLIVGSNIHTIHSEDRTFIY